MTLLSLLFACQQSENVITNQNEKPSEPIDSLNDSGKAQDTFLQTEATKQDVLWVIDNSGSMGDHQEKMSNNAKGFLNYFSGQDYHIGIVTTDNEEFVNQDGFEYLTPEADEILSSEGTSGAEAFSNAFLVGTDGDSREEGIEKGYLALINNRETDPADPRFLRNDATLDVVVVSDEDDLSENITMSDVINFSIEEKIRKWFTKKTIQDTGARPSEDQIQDVLANYHSLEVEQQESMMANIEAEQPFLRYNIIIKQEDDVCDGNGRYGLHYDILNDVIGGQSHSICEEDWSPLLKTLAQEVSGMKTKFLLSQLPVENSIAVTVDPIDAEPYSPQKDLHWSYDYYCNCIQFEASSIPEAGARIYADYQLRSY